MDVPQELAEWHERFFGAAGRAWIAALPDLAAAGLSRWNLSPDGPARFGAVALVLPVRRADGTPAALKLQPVNDETVGEPVALAAWHGHGAVPLLAHDPATGRCCSPASTPAATCRRSRTTSKLCGSSAN